MSASDDTISRQAAIDAYGDWYVEEGTEEGFIGTVKQLLEGLPPAQPEIAERITETAQNVSDEDLISRKAAIVAVCNSECESGFCGIPCPEVDALKALPSAQPKRKRGKWIYGEDEYGIDGYHCDKCGFFVPWDYAHKFINYIEDYNFCPNCGADMREGGKK